MKTFLYKAHKSLFPCFLLTLSIGFCYAFSLFAPPVKELLGVSQTAVQFAFCLNIFFLGMGAATFGALVEKNIRRAAWLSTALLFSGLCVSGLAMRVESVWLFYLGMGVMCGLAEGVGYVTPVKNLLLFFGRSRHKALIMAISIVSFGLGSSFCSWVFKYAYPVFGIKDVFFFYAGLYLVMSAASALMIDKPVFAKAKLKKETGKKYSISRYLKDPFFLRHWIFMFLNISAGLVIIGRCAGMLAGAGLSAGAVITVMMLCGFGNGGGRLLFPAVSDYMRNRASILLVALGLEIAAMCSVAWIPGWLTAPAFILVNMCYGCGFAMAPAVLADHYGSGELSFAHGLLLSAWGFASLFAFILGSFVLGTLQLSAAALFMVLAAVYAANYVNTSSLVKKAKIGLKA